MDKELEFKAQPDPEKMEEYLKRLEKYEARLKSWREAHGDRMAPPIHVTKDDEWHWINRATRRKLMKKKSK